MYNKTWKKPNMNSWPVMTNSAKAYGFVLFILRKELHTQKISFGGIPNSSSIDILIPHAIFDYMGAFLWFCPSGQCYPRDQNNHMAAPVKVAKQQTTPELSGTFRNLAPEPAPATRTGTHRSLSGLKTPLAYAVGKKKHVRSDEPAAPWHCGCIWWETLGPNG